MCVCDMSRDCWESEMKGWDFFWETARAWGRDDRSRDWCTNMCDGEGDGCCG